MLESPRRTCWARTAVLCLVLARGLPAQSPTSSDRSPAEAVGTIRGPAIDSLDDKPLVGASIAIDGTTLTATSDSAGAFRFTDLALGRYQLALYHPLHDSLEIGVSTAHLTLRAGDTARVVLAVPFDGCVRYVIDGRTFPTYKPDDLDTYVRPNTIAGVEVYEPGTAPPEIAFGPDLATCTIAVIWTKAFLGLY